MMTMAKIIANGYFPGHPLANRPTRRRPCRIADGYLHRRTRVVWGRPVSPTASPGNGPRIQNRDRCGGACVRHPVPPERGDRRGRTRPSRKRRLGRHLPLHTVRQRNASRLHQASPALPVVRQRAVAHRQRRRQRGRSPVSRAQRPSSEGGLAAHPTGDKCRPPERDPARADRGRRIDRQFVEDPP